MISDPTLSPPVAQAANAAIMNNLNIPTSKMISRDSLFFASSFAFIAPSRFRIVHVIVERALIELSQRLAARTARPGMLGNVYATQTNRIGLSVTRRMMHS